MSPIRYSIASHDSIKACNSLAISRQKRSLVISYQAGVVLPNPANAYAKISDWLPT